MAWKLIFLLRKSWEVEIADFPNPWTLKHSYEPRQAGQTREVTKKVSP
jgi:hypothetical protein